MKTDTRVEGRSRGTTAMTLPEWTKWEKRPSPNQEAETEFGTTKFKNWKHIKVARTNSPHGRALARWPTSTRSLLSQRHLLSGFFLFFYPNKVCFVLTPTHSWNFSGVSQELGDHLTQERSWTMLGQDSPWCGSGPVTASHNLYFKDCSGYERWMYYSRQKWPESDQLGGWCRFYSSLGRNVGVLE